MRTSIQPYSKLLQGVLGSNSGTTIGVTYGDTRNLDYGSNVGPSRDLGAPLEPTGDGGRVSGEKQSEVRLCCPLKV